MASTISPRKSTSVGTRMMSLPIQLRVSVLPNAFEMLRALVLLQISIFALVGERDDDLLLAADILRSNGADGHAPRFAVQIYTAEEL